MKGTGRSAGCETVMTEMLRVLMANTDSVQIIDKQHRQRDRKVRIPTRKHEYEKHQREALVG